MREKKGKSLRILYAAGPGDVAGTFRHWSAGEDDPSQVNMTLSGLFYDLCRENGDKAYVIGSSTKPAYARDADFIIVHRATRFGSSSAVLYHIGQVWTALRLVASAIWFRADVAVVVCGTCHWFPLRLLPLFGVKVVPSLHCVLWLKYRPMRRVPRFIRGLNRKFFTKSVHRILSMSQDITDQLTELTGGRQKPVLQFLPTYKPKHFDGIRPPDRTHRPFRVFFAGRVERDKGVFDVLEIAKRFREAKITDVVFDICGRGSASDELTRLTAEAGVSDTFLLHGFCNRPVMREMFSNSHVVIVPTTTEFVEGFNQVVSEAVLAGRPVVSSAVCPAIHYLRDAVVEVPPDDVKAYGDAILALRDDEALYQKKANARQMIEAPFYDVEKGWGAALREALRSLRTGSSSALPAESAVRHDPSDPEMAGVHD